MAVQKHDAGLKKAKDLVGKDEYVKESDWSEAEPSADEENDFIDEHGMEAYGRWHLAENTDYDEDDKGRWEFPYGDFRRVHRSAVKSAKQRAAQQDYGSVADAADELLDRLPDPND